MDIQSVFFGLLQVAVCDKTASDELKAACTDETLEKVSALALRYDLAHLIGLGVSKLNLPQSGVAKQCMQQQMQAMFRFVQLEYEYNRVCDVLERAQIVFLPLKGSVLRQWYPEPWMRTSCDMDILVHEADLEKASEILQSQLQYTLAGRGAHDWAFSAPGGVHLELHYTVMESTELAMLPKLMESIWEEAAPADGKRYHMVLSDPMFYCYHIAHMAKHFEIGGCGIRPFLDIWVLQNKMAYQQDQREEMLKKGGLLQFASAAENLSRVWFSGAEADAISAQMERFIFGGGSYGGVENRVAVTRAKDKGRFSYLLGRVFLPYENMKQVYPVLEKRKWLLPFCHIARWFKRLFDGGVARSARELQANASITQEKTLSTAQLLEHLGLK